MGIYMDMISYVGRFLDSRFLSPYLLFQLMLGPINIREDGTYVFATPFTEEPVPLIALSDLGYFVRYTFDHREEMSGRDLHISSEPVSWPVLVETFKKVTGKPAVWKPISVDEWFSTVGNTQKPLATENNEEGGTTWEQNFRCWWVWWRDSMKLWTDVRENLEDGTLRKINPGLRDVEMWMKESGWTGEMDWNLLKRPTEGTSSISLDLEKRKKM